MNDFNSPIFTEKHMQNVHDTKLVKALVAIKYQRSPT